MVAPMQPGNNYPITGRSTTKKVFDRLPVQELEADHPYQWTLFVLGFAYINGTPIPFPGVVQPRLPVAASLMEIGGIHGKPYREWAGDKRALIEAQIDFSYLDRKDMYPSPSRFGGYCHHASITFPSWHRPYVMLVEQAIGEYAENIAQQIENCTPTEAGRWTDAAEQLRFPYWDWADPIVDKEGLPSLFYSEELTVMGTGQKHVTVPNPLSFFKFPYIPHDFQDQTRNGATASFTEWKQTYRHVVNSGNSPETNIQELQATLKKQGEDLRTKVGMLFSFPDGGNPAMIYDEFSNARNESRQDDNYTNVGSLESVHNSVHGVLGGNGHMGYPDYAGFDPIFYFHHCNVDRLLALWDWCYPDYWMNNGYTVDGVEHNWTLRLGTYSEAYNQRIDEGGNFGFLVPFRHPDGTYWTSKETRFLTPDAYPKYYSYKEAMGVKVDKPAASLKERQEARAKLAKFYRVDPQTAVTTIHAPSWTHITVPGAGEVDLPSNFQAIKNFRLFNILVRLPEHAVGGTYHFQVFHKEELVGNVTVFAREDNSPCKACAVRRDAESSVRGVIAIPPRIVNDIIVHSGIDRSKNTMEITVGLITKALSGKILELSGKVLASAQGGETASVPAGQAASKRIQPVEVTLLSSAVAEHVDDAKQPVHFFDWKRHKDVFPSGWKAESPAAR